MADKFDERKDKSAAELRKINKPLMERKRRERINNCLNQLKMFLMETTKKDSSYYSKLEKADILELTVKYLKSLQRQQMAVAMVTDPKVASKYTAGYSQCADEVTRYLAKLDGFSPEVRSRLLSHLTGCIHKVASSGAAAASAGGAGSASGLPTPMHSALPTPLQGQPEAATMSGSSGSSLLSMTLLRSLSQSTMATSQTHAQESESPDVPMLLPTSLTTMGLPSGGVSGRQAVLLSGSQPAMSTVSSATPVTSGQQQNVPVLPVQLIPAKLPSGDVVLLMANTSSVPMATNVLTSPVSIQIPTGSGTTLPATCSTAQVVGGAALPVTTTTAAAAAGGSGAPSGLPSLNIGGTTVVGLPGSGSVGLSLSSSTSVAVVPPNSHESKPHPSLVPTDLSMKADPGKRTAAGDEGGGGGKPGASSPPTPPQAPLSLLVTPRSRSPRVTSTCTSSGGFSLSSVTSAAAVSSTSSSSSAMTSSQGNEGDENNNVDPMDLCLSHDVTSGLSSSDESRDSPSPRLQAAESKPEVDDNEGNAPGPSGSGGLLGPMWRPW